MRLRDQSGFTLIELLMVILLVAILSAVAIPQFIDFRTEARDAAVNSALGAVRTGIANASAQMKIRCDAPSGAWPSLNSVNGNSLITGGDCTAAQITNAAEAQIVASPALPGNEWGANQSAAVTTCVGAGTGCNQLDATACDGNPYDPATSDGWCYNPATGQLWANSANSTGPELEYNF